MLGARPHSNLKATQDTNSTRSPLNSFRTNRQNATSRYGTSITGLS